MKPTIAFIKGLDENRYCLATNRGNVDNWPNTASIFGTCLNKLIGESNLEKIPEKFAKRMASENLWLCIRGQPGRR